MSKFFRNNSEQTAHSARVIHEKKLIEENYDPQFAHCLITWSQGKALLTCHVHYWLNDEDIHFRIQYKGYSSPTAWIVSPKIKDPQHIYHEGNLCLFDPDTDEWTEESHIYNTFIPWCQQWIIFQRLYEETGVWQPPERQH